MAIEPYWARFMKKTKLYWRKMLSSRSTKSYIKWDEFRNIIKISACASETFNTLWVIEDVRNAVNQF